MGCGNSIDNITFDTATGYSFTCGFTTDLKYDSGGQLISETRAYDETIIKRNIMYHNNKKHGIETWYTDKSHHRAVNIFHQLPWINGAIDGLEIWTYNRTILPESMDSKYQNKVKQPVIPVVVCYDIPTDNKDSIEGCCNWKNGLRHGQSCSITLNKEDYGDVVVDGEISSGSVVRYLEALVHVNINSKIPFESRCQHYHNGILDGMLTDAATGTTRSIFISNNKEHGIEQQINNGKTDIRYWLCGKCVDSKQYDNYNNKLIAFIYDIACNGVTVLTLLIMDYMDFQIK